MAELDSLPRGAASALDWFGVTTFLLIALVLWLGFFAADERQSAPAWPPWLQREIPGYHYPFRFIPFALATLLTCIWVVVVARSLRTTRRAVVNWSAGITMVWMLTMMLGLPLIDQARSYRGVAGDSRRPLARRAAPCGAGVGDAQRALLDYFIGLRLVRAEAAAMPRGATRSSRRCPSGRSPPVDASRWKETWRGSRPGDRSEAFVLYRRAH